MNKSSKSNYCLCTAVLLACSFILRIIAANADSSGSLNSTVNLFQKTNPEKLLEAVRNVGTARAIDETLLDYREMERKD